MPHAITHRILHTGQHYDEKMAKVFFQQFGLEPDFWLDVPPGSPNSQIARIMLGIEEVVLNQYKPDLLMVVGDVNSTLAAAMTGHALKIPVAHVESGLRSFDRSMPEEINRILTDEVADYFFVTEQSGIDNLRREGKDPARIFFVGNTMIDTLVAFEPQIMASQVLNELGLEAGSYVLMTIHRPSNVDQEAELRKLLTLIEEITAHHLVVFPIHPRTRHNLEKFGLWEQLSGTEGLIFSGPLDYFAFQRLVKSAFCVLTDSGGIQEETTFQGVPCLTLRPNTERPVTIDLGTNELIPFDLELIRTKLQAIRRGQYKQGQIPPHWDGQATARIAHVVQDQIRSIL